VWDGKPRVGWSTEQVIGHPSSVIGFQAKRFAKTGFLPSSLASPVSNFQFRLLKGYHSPFTIFCPTLGQTPPHDVQTLESPTKVNGMSRLL